MNTTQSSKLCQQKHTTAAEITIGAINTKLFTFIVYTYKQQDAAAGDCYCCTVDHSLEAAAADDC
jgi:hypothetical protein